MKRFAALAALFVAFACSAAGQTAYVPTCLSPAAQAKIVADAADLAPLLTIDLTDPLLRFADAQCSLQGTISTITNLLANVQTLNQQVAALQKQIGTPPAPAPTIQNPSFETFNALTLSGPGVYNHGPIPSWTGSGGSWQPSAAAFTSLCNGPTVAFTTGALTQDLGAAPAAAGTYVLKACTGLRADSAADAAATWTLSLFAGGTQLCATSGPNSAIPAGTMVLQTLTCAMPAAIPPGDLVVQLSATGGEAVFDNVSLVKQ